MHRRVDGVVELALFDTLDFLLNEYFIELNTANFNILNKFLNLGMKASKFTDEGPTMATSFKAVP